MNGIGIVIAILGLGLLIMIHEMGHFFAGKLLGLKVLEFGLGLPLGPKLASRKRGDTTYVISSVLFGGYVKFIELLAITELKVMRVVEGSAAQKAGFEKGDLIKEVDGETVSEWLDLYKQLSAAGDREVTLTVRRRGSDERLTFVPEGFGGIVLSKDDKILIEDIGRSFDAQKTWKRALIVFAGPAMNLSLAVIIIFFISLVGFPKPSTTLEKVVPGSPAKVAGIRAGDRIVSIAGVKAASWERVTGNIRKNAGNKVEIVVVRGRERLTFNPTLRKKSTKGLLGVVTKIVRQPLTPFEGIVEGFSFIGRTTVLIGQFLGTMVTTPAKVLPFVRSPIGIVRETAPIATRDILDYLATLAGLSVAIGIFNLLPMPPLDGGRIFISGIEGLLRRPISRQAMLVSNAVGISVLLLLMTYAVIGDIFRSGAAGG